jgi:hypothetical protein
MLPFTFRGAIKIKTIHTMSLEMVYSLVFGLATIPVRLHYLFFPLSLFRFCVSKAILLAPRVVPVLEPTFKLFC